MLVAVCYHRVWMRRTLVVLALVAAAGVAGALAYASYTTEQDFVRLVAEGDQAAAAGRTFEALEAYSGALALVPDAVVAYLKRGRVYQLQGEAEAALRDLRRAAELDPSATRPLEWLGDISLELNRVDRAAEYFQRYNRPRRSQRPCARTSSAWPGIAAARRARRCRCWSRPCGSTAV